MIDVALTAAGVRSARTAVVIDVLRATSTATEALAAGYRRVLCVETLARALELRAPGRVLAGERHCLKPPEFDQGNSPSEVRTPLGDELVLSTTNGAPTILAAAASSRSVLLACMLNLDRVIAELEARGGGEDGDVQIVCSGTDGAVSLEDTYVAGRLIAPLAGRRSDAALLAEAVAQAFPSPLDALAASADASVLRAAGMADDIADCARDSALDVVPSVVETRADVAIVAPLPD